jgi:hypothetical protein
MKKVGIGVYFLLLLAGCSTVPSKLPDLLGKTADTVDVQAAWTVSEWEKAILSSNSSLKLIDQILPVIKSLDQNTLDSDSKARVANFLRGVDPVKKQLQTTIDQAEMPKEARDNFKTISGVIKFSNTYLEKVVDENKRVETAIETVSSLATKVKKGADK